MIKGFKAYLTKLPSGLVEGLDSLEEMKKKVEI